MSKTKKKPKRSRAAERRKIIQIATTTMQVGDVVLSNLVVLTNQGDVLQYSPRHDPPWSKFPDLPVSIFVLPEVSDRDTQLKTPAGES